MKNVIVLIFSIVIINFIYNCYPESENYIFMGHEDRACVSEVYLDTIDIDKTWIELYNPCEYDIEIDGGRYSHIKTINHLPSFTIHSKKYLVLCANDSVFQNNYSKISNILEIPSIGYLSSEGGFFAFWSMCDTIQLSDAIKYGKPFEWTDDNWIQESALIPFLHNNQSCLLWIIDKNENCNIYDYKISSPSPGYGDY